MLKAIRNPKRLLFLFLSFSVIGCSIYISIEKEKDINLNKKEPPKDLSDSLKNIQCQYKNLRK